MTSRWALAATLAGATLLAYANGLSSPFVLDDSHSIVENPTIRTLTPLSRVLSGPPQSPTAGRPSVNLSFALNYASSGLSPRGYRATNLVLHVLNGLLLFAIVRRTCLALARADAEAERTDRSGRHGDGAAAASPPKGESSRDMTRAGRRAARAGRSESVRRRTPSGAENSASSFWPADAIAFAAALLWLLHPIQSEVVDYVTQRTESMMALAFLATLYASERAMTATRPAPWYAAAIVACAVGMTCKESMVTAPIVVLLYDVVFHAGRVSRALRERGAFYAGLAACWLVLVPLVWSGPRSHSAGFHNTSGLSPWTYLLNQPSMILRYLQRAILPLGLVFDYGLPKNLTLPQAWPATAAVVLSAGAVAAAWWKSRPLSFLGAWFFITLAPASSIIPIATEVGAERRMYLPLAALAVLGAVMLHRLVVNRTAATAILLSIGACYGALVVRRNTEYHNGLRLWQTVVDRYPHARGRYNLGLELKAAGRRAEAIAAYQAAAAELPDAEYALGFESAADGDHARAVEHLRAYAKARPDDVNVVRAYYLIGRSLVAMGKVDDAIVAFQEVLRMQPGNPDATGALGQVFLQRERFGDAAEKFAEYVRLVPKDPKAHFNLGLALEAAGRHREAADAFQSAVNLDPREPAFHANLAQTLVALGHEDAAIEHFQAVERLEPDPAVRAQIAEVVKELSRTAR